jgi:ATP-dependent protease ClpP protease subunit
MKNKRLLMKRRADDGLAYHSWFESGLSIEGRIIILNSTSQGDEIDIGMSLHFLKCMDLLESNNNTEPICVILNSTGGDIHSSFAIYDRIKESSCKVCVRGYGAVMSGASIIMQAGALRQMSPNAYMMVHNGNIMLDNDMNKAKKWVTAYDDMSKVMYEIYYNAAKKKNKKITIEEIKNMCNDETILNSQRALELGFIDYIYKG